MKKQIFVDGRAFDKYFEGTRTYVENLYKVIDKIGDFKIFVASETNNAQDVFKNSANIEFLKYKSSSKIQRILFDIPNLIAKYKIDASHFQYIVPPIKNNIQVVTIHDILFKDYPDEFSLKYRFTKGLTFYASARRADIVTTVSNHSKEAMIKHFNLDEKEVHIIPNGVAEHYFENYNKSQAQEKVFKHFGLQNFILYVSRIEPRKNQLLLLKAYLNQQLYNQNVALVFVGKKDLPVPELEQLITSLPQSITKHISFLSNINNDDLKSIYQAARIFAYPSKAEGFGIPPLESAALGIPTICSNTTAMSDFTFFGKTHITPDLSSIETALTQNITDPPSESQLLAIKNTVQNTYSWQSAAQKLNELIWNKLNT